MDTGAARVASRWIKNWPAPKLLPITWQHWRNFPWPTNSKSSVLQHLICWCRATWLIGRLGQEPDLMGDHVPELKNLALPI